MFEFAAGLLLVLGLLASSDAAAEDAVLTTHQLGRWKLALPTDMMPMAKPMKSARWQAIATRPGFRRRLKAFCFVPMPVARAPVAAPLMRGPNCAR